MAGSNYKIEVQMKINGEFVDSELGKLGLELTNCPLGLSSVLVAISDGLESFENGFMSSVDDIIDFGGE